MWVLLMLTLMDAYAQPIFFLDVSVGDDTSMPSWSSVCVQAQSSKALRERIPLQLQIQLQTPDPNTHSPPCQGPWTLKSRVCSTFGKYYVPDPMLREACLMYELAAPAISPRC